MVGDMCLTGDANLERGINAPLCSPGKSSAQIWKLPKFAHPHLVAALTQETTNPSEYCYQLMAARISSSGSSKARN